MNKDPLVLILELITELKQEIIEIKEKLFLTSNRVEKAKKIIKARGYISKKQLITEQFGSKGGRYWQAWQEIKYSLDRDPDFLIFHGVGNSETMIIYSGNHNSPVSLAAKIFKQIKKGKSLTKDQLIKYGVEDKEKEAVFNIIVNKLFRDRVKLLTGVGVPPKMVKKY